MVMCRVAQEKVARTYNVSILATLKEVVPVIPDIQAFENLLSFLFSHTCNNFCKTWIHNPIVLKFHVKKNIGCILVPNLVKCKYVSMAELQTIIEEKWYQYVVMLSGKTAYANCFATTYIHVHGLLLICIFQLDSY